MIGLGVWIYDSYMYIWICKDTRYYMKYRKSVRARRQEQIGVPEALR